MNTEYRNKLFNRIKDVFENEDTPERQAFLQARENFNAEQKNAFDLARRVVERSYPTEDVNTLKYLKENMKKFVIWVQRQMFLLCTQRRC